jgi:hypothetical protein
MESPDLIEQRIKKIEDALGITGTHSPATLCLTAALPVGTVIITKTNTNSLGFGTWALMDSGNLLGGTSGTVYAWKRTA